MQNFPARATPRAVQLHLHLDPVFDPSGPAQEVALRWSKWKRSFSYYIYAEGITDSKRKRSKLLHLAGLDVQDIFDTLPDPPVPTGGTALVNYEKAIAMLDLYFAFKPNVVLECHAFRQLAQKEQEAVAQFLNRLQQQSQQCNFSSVEEQICYQLVEAVVDDRLRQTFLEKQGSMTVKDALEIARLYEATAAGARVMSQSSYDAATVRQVQQVSRIPISN